MSWEWSHTDEAYANVHENIDRLSRAELLMILREWAHYDRDKAGTLRRRKNAKRPEGFRLPAHVRSLPHDVLADQVWERAAQHRTCDNGGWNAYACPYGCHTVPFDAPQERIDR